MDKHSYIAVFDSGVGGVSVLRELRALMPGERFYYFGDTFGGNDFSFIKQWNASCLLSP